MILKLIGVSGDKMENETQESVLVVEDNSNDRESIRRLIGSDVTLSEADSGQGGLKLAMSQRPDCVLLDYRLPDVDGLTLVPNLVAQGIPVVIMTSVGSEAVAVEAMKAGAQDYVTKDQITQILLLKVIRLAIESVKMRRKLLEQQTEMARFVSVASHDLRAPLRHIVSFANLAKQECVEKVNPEVLGYLDRVITGGERMAELLEALILFARSGRSDDVLGRVCLATVVKHALSNLSIEIDESNADISVEPLPTVYGHEPSLIELMQNLIGNAIKYSGDNDPQIDLSISLTETGIWTVCVRDNGIGIAQEYHEKIFKPFSRLHAFDAIEGSGIGLASCQRIVDHHGGKIWVESEPDQGSAFFFTLRTIEAVASDRSQ